MPGGLNSACRWFGAVMGILLLQACADSASSPSHSKPADQVPLFSLVAPVASGIHFINKLPENPDMNILTYQYFYNGGGVSIGDINGDGYPDVYLTANFGTNRLYLNKGTGKLEFEDITDKAGVAGSIGWCTGTVMEDVNQDGHLDIYVLRSGRFPAPNRANELFINNGDGTFTEMAAEFGLADQGHGTQAAFFDYDKDGDLDMYLMNHSVETFKNFDVAEMKARRDPNAGDKLFRNDGGTYMDVSVQAGISGNPMSYGLGLGVADLNNDGWTDIYIGNDFLENDYLYINQRDGTFRNTIHTSVGHTSNFSMGLDIADFNNDGLMDIIVADMAAEDNYRSKANMSGMNIEKFWQAVASGFHYQYMINTLQRNNGNGTFSEISQLAGVSKTDWSWAPLFADFDNDGYKDLLVTNGLRKEARNNDFLKVKRKYLADAKGKSPEEQRKILADLLAMMPSEKLKNYMFRNSGTLEFENVTDDWGLTHKSFSNGAAYGDLDNDGDLDIVINNIDEVPFVYENNEDRITEHDWLKVVLAGPNKNIGGTDAKLTLRMKDEVQVIQKQSSRGYQSSVDYMPVHFGLGSADANSWKNPGQQPELIIEWPDGKVERQRISKPNQVVLIDYKNASADGLDRKEPASSSMFAEITEQSGLNHFHIENEFDDFEKEILLPHRTSTLGPGLAVGDVNADGMEDFYIGGAAGSQGVLYLQSTEGTFVWSNSQPWRQDQGAEDMDALFVDVDGDGDLDLYVVSGGNEFEPASILLQDRLYLNDGKGIFRKSATSLPQFLTSGSCVAAGDYDGDGDLDLFVGGRVTPGRYPSPPSSHILRNDEGIFTEVTSDISEDLLAPGMVTDARWTDFNYDGVLDLIVVGEWMPVLMMKNDGERLISVGEEYLGVQSAGWWFSIQEADLNSDGRPDYILGNLGLNYKYQASEKEPFEIYAEDFDDNGTYDIVLSYYNKGESYPVRGRECSSQQMPFITEKFENYDAFAKSNIFAIYSEEKLKEALHYTAYNFNSSILINNGDEFSMKSLPIEAQISAVNGIVAKDFDQDGKCDLLIAGNLYDSEVETPRNDAGTGLFLKGDGTGGFHPVPLRESGFWAPGNVKDLMGIELANNRKGILVARNNGILSLIGLVTTGS